MIPRNTNRWELEEIWRSKLEQARRRYGDTLEACRELSAHVFDSASPDPASVLTRAQEARFEALTEYLRMLQVFTDLTVYGKPPEDHEPSDCGR